LRYRRNAKLIEVIWPPLPRPAKINFTSKGEAGNENLDVLSDFVHGGDVHRTNDDDKHGLYDTGYWRQYGVG